MLPVGTHQLDVSKGPEYAVIQKTIEISAEIGTAIAAPQGKTEPESAPFPVTSGNT